MDWNILSAVGATASAAAAAWQLWRLRRDALDARAAEIRSVSISTLVKFRPVESDVRDGRADWVYEYTINNPGRLPIFDVRAEVSYPCELQRRHYDGSLDAPTRTLKIRASVVPPRSSHPARRRTLSVSRSDWDQLESATVTITFHAQDLGVWTNAFPDRSQPGRRASALKRRLRAA